MPFQILSLSGGGFLGLYTISLLTQLEEKLGKPIASCFDLLAGTSIGGIIALGLALEKPAKEIKSAFERNGVQIFSGRAAPRNRIEEWRDFYRSLFKSKYDGKALYKTIVDLVGEDTVLANLKHRTIIPTVNLTKGKPQVFKTAHHKDFQLDWKRRVVDVALAAAAAPTYFPIAEIDDELFVDGGLYANSPDLLALHEAEHFLNVQTEDVKILSIGTTTTRFSFSHVGKRDLGVLGWGRRLAHTMISSQQLDVSYILTHKLGNRYLRLDEVQSKEQERDLGLDVTTQAAQQTIRGIAAGSFQASINNNLLADMLRHEPPQPQFYHAVDSVITEAVH